MTNTTDKAMREALQSAFSALDRTDSEPGSDAFEREKEAMDEIRGALASVPSAGAETKRPHDTEDDKPAEVPADRAALADAVRARLNDVVSHISALIRATNQAIIARHEGAAKQSIHLAHAAIDRLAAAPEAPGTQDGEALEEAMRLVFRCESAANPKEQEARYRALRAFLAARLRPVAPLSEPTMADAIAAGDGTLHGAIDYWQARALAAEAKVPSEAEQDAHATNQVLANNYLHLTCAPPAAPLSEPTAEGVTEDEWLALAERHAIADWTDGYLNAVKALCTDFAALSSPASSAGSPSDDELWDQTLAERDRYHERADELAGAIAAHLGIDIGEHSNLNDPWQNALAAIASSAGMDAHGEPVDAVKELKLAAAHASTFPRDTMVVPLDEAVSFVAQSGEPVAWHFTEMQSGDVHVDWVEPERDQRDRYWIRPLVYGDTRPAAPAEPADPVTEACRDVLGERRRQVEAEGWTAQGDDDYANGQLALAAAAYALADHVNPQDVPACWPWGRAWFKANDERRNLVKAGALILAEIERLDRAALRTATTPTPPPAEPSPWRPRRSRGR